MQQAVVVAVAAHRGEGMCVGSWARVKPRMLPWPAWTYIELAGCRQLLVHLLVNPSIACSGMGASTCFTVMQPLHQLQG